MMANQLLPALITVSEKAGNIARICRQDEHLLSLLIQEKKEGEKNPRFLTDFKTLADVLVQELVKFYLCSKFPLLQGHIYGEENNEFLSGGETIVIEVKSSVTETAELLNKILNDLDASSTLAKAIHSDIDEKISTNIDVPKLPDSCGIWIDPIDATSEYIRGELREENGLVLAGLPCVTILIGVFDLETGEPIMGVVNQPFNKVTESSWTGSYIYGLSCAGVNYFHPDFFPHANNAVAVSTSENEEIKNALLARGFDVLEIAGAGYKLMNVITGNVKAYILSKPTCFQWDTCACHAILKAIGGGIIDFTLLTPIRYSADRGIDNCCHKGGILAYRSEHIKDDIFEIFKLGSSKGNN